MSKQSLLAILSDNPLSLKSLLSIESVYSAFALELVDSNYNNCANDADSLYLRVAYRALRSSEKIDEQLSPSSFKKFLSMSIETDSMDHIYDAINDTLTQFEQAFFNHGFIESHSPAGCASPCFILTDKGKGGFPLTYEKAMHLFSKDK